MKDAIASELSLLVTMLKKHGGGLSMQTLIQLGKVAELLEEHDDLPGAGTLHAVYRQYRDALETPHISAEIYLDRDAALAAAEEALSARNEALPDDEQVHREVKA